MLLKLIILAALGIVVYRFFGGKVPFLDKKPSSGSRTSPNEKAGTMVECTRCSTWVVVEETTIINGQYVCDECAQS